MPIPSWEQCPQEGGREKVKIEKPPQYPILHISFTPLHFCSIFLFKDTVFIILHLTSISFLGKVLHKELLKIYPHKPRVVSLSPILSPPQFNTLTFYTHDNPITNVLVTLSNAHIHPCCHSQNTLFLLFLFLYILVGLFCSYSNTFWMVHFTFILLSLKEVCCRNQLFTFILPFLPFIMLVFFPSSNDRSFLENFRTFFNLKL